VIYLLVHLVYGDLFTTWTILSFLLLTLVSYVTYSNIDNSLALGLDVKSYS
jgi:hypothetical protein